MYSRRARRLRIWFLLAASGLTVWVCVGVLGNRSGYTDALFEPDYTIVHAPAGGPLADAGFQPGDSVVSVEGIPVVDLGMYSRWPRSLARRPGEFITMVVDRNGERISGEVVYRERPSGSRNMQVGGLLVGLSFIWFGVWALFVAPSSHALRLAAMGLALGLALPGPDLGSWNGVRDHIQAAAMVLWALVLLRFFLLFPNPKKMATRKGLTAALFLPWVILLGCLAVELAYHPRFYHTFGPLYGLLVAAYVVMALAVMVHTAVKTPQDELRISGMGWVLAGVGLGVGGVALWMILALVPSISVPGSGWLPVLVGAIPAGMALGVRSQVRRNVIPR